MADTTNETVYDVIVIGGGISGLSAAWDLIKNQKVNGSSPSVLLVEANSRLGGRTYTIDLPPPFPPGTKVDLGGQWVGPTQKNIMGIIDELGLEIYPQYDEGKKVMDYNDSITTFSGTIPGLPIYGLLDLQLSIINRVEHLYQFVPASDPLRDGQAREWDNKSAETWKLASTWTRSAQESFDLAIAAVLGCESPDISLLYFLFYVNSAGGMMKLLDVKDGAQNHRVKGGTQQISEKLAEKIQQHGGKVELNYEVRKIHQNESGVTIEDRKGEVRKSKYLIIATAPTVAYRIEYDPPLPPKREQLSQRLFMGCYMKCLVLYPDSFWRKEGYSGEIVGYSKDFENNPISFAYDATNSDMTVNAICAFIVGSRALHWSSKTSEERKVAIINALVKYLGVKASNPLYYIDYDWSKDQYARGCPVNLFAPGAMTNTFDALRAPIQNIHFAATDTAEEWCGYMDGAVQSGRRAASEVTARLNSSA